MATFKAGQESAISQSLGEAQNLWKLVLESYSQAQKNINKELSDIYAKVLSGVKPEDYYNTLLKFNRLSNLKKTISKQYLEASKKAGRLMAESSEIAISNV